MDDKVREFLEKNHDAVMTTVKKDGAPHVARVGVGLVDGKLWSSGTQTRVRTKHLRRDRRSTLMVMDASTRYRWMGLECNVTILDGPDAPQLNLALYRALAGEPDDVDEYLEAMVKEQRLIYEFEIGKTYGMS
ncbi:MAG: TIGR03618 family F420-dependent PPOX class oxidoreductase [Actinomycetota bacterium]|nr:TIGR03618 family F420-dependent PPOX class oxidoreductase [Actinomycetota bacterium]